MTKQPEKSPKSEQPIQLALFRLTGPSYTNAFEFYESIPRFLASGEKTKYSAPDGSIRDAKRSKEGNLQPIKRSYIHQQQAYNLTIKPASLEDGDGFRSAFPGVREELIEFVIFKLAIKNGYFDDGEEGDATQTDNYVVYTTVYEIQEELKKRKETKNAPYNYSQIIAGLQVLSETKYVLQGESKDNSFTFSPFVEFGYVNRDAEEGRLDRNATIYIKLNSLVSKSILAKSWRQISYDGVMKERSFLGRCLRKTLALRFTQASLLKPYNIRLSTLVNNSGLTPFERVTDSLKYVRKILDGLDLISHYDVKQHYEQSDETGRKRLVDATLLLFPSKTFVGEQMRVNAEHKRLQDAQIDGEGLPLLPPKKGDHATPLGYQRAISKFEDAKRK